MDQLKIGKFIAQCRKQNNLTQVQLAEKLNITDRAVSKWENGKAMPDSSIMLELCDVLQITVNDLLNGERISSEDYKQKIEEQLVGMVQQKEVADKRLRKIAMLFLAASVILSLIAWFALFFSDFSAGWIIAGNILLLLCFFFATDLSVKLFRCSGYCRCTKCGYTYVPTYRAMLWASFGTKNKITIRCPKCEKRLRHEWVSSP